MNSQLWRQTVVLFSIPYIIKKQASACFSKIYFNPYGLPVLLKKLRKGIHIVNAAFFP